MELFEEHGGELQHLTWPAQSPDVNIIQPVWSVLETRVRNRFPPSSSLKQPEDVLQEEWYKIPLETVQNLYESIPRTAAVSKQKVLQHHINKEMCTVICSASIILSNPCKCLQYQSFTADLIVANISAVGADTIA
jgi:hypothetical protein